MVTTLFERLMHGSAAEEELALVASARTTTTISEMQDSRTARAGGKSARCGAVDAIHLLALPCQMEYNPVYLFQALPNEFQPLSFQPFPNQISEMPIHELIEGVHHFQGRAFRDQQELFTRLADGQSPETLFITCSDSRIDPNLITHTDPGDLFVLRNAGNIIPAYGGPGGGEVATIEFALAGLGVRNIVVCGHSHCGAMKGLLNPQVLGDMPAVAEFLKHAEATRRIVRTKYQHLSGNDLLDVTIEENVLVQIECLQTHPAVAVALSQGLLSLHAWVYDIPTGDVYAYDTECGQFKPLIGVRPEGHYEQPARIKDIRSGDASFRGQGVVGK